MFDKLLIKLGLNPQEVKSISSVAVGNVSAQTFRLLFWLAVIWVVTPEEYGYVKYSLTIATFFSIPIVSGFAGAITKFISEHGDDRKKMEIYAFHTISFDLLVMFLILVLGLFFNLIDSKDFSFLSIYFVLILGVYNIYASYSRGLLDIRRIVLFSVSVNLSRVIFVVLFYFLNLFGILWVIVAYSFPLLIGLFIGEIFGKKRLEMRRHSFNRKIMKKILVFALPGILSTTMWTFVGQINIIFVKSYLGLEEVAYYSLARTLSSTIAFFSGAIIVLHMPKISSFKTDKKRIHEYTKKSLKLGSISMTFLAIFLYIFAAAVVGRFFPPSYKASLSLIYVLIPGTIFGGLFAILGATWIGYGKPIEEAKAVFSGFISIIFLNFLLIPLYGVLGSALAFTFSQMLIFSLLYFRTIKYFRIDE